MIIYTILTYEILTLLQTYENTEKNKISSHLIFIISIVFSAPIFKIIPKQTLNPN